MSETPFTSFNMNARAKVKLTQAGLDAYRANWERLNKLCQPHEQFSTDPKLDADGFYHTLLWELFRDFGQQMGMGLSVPFEGNRIWIEISD